MRSIPLGAEATRPPSTEAARNRSWSTAAVSSPASEARFARINASPMGGAYTPSIALRLRPKPADRPNDQVDNSLGPWRGTITIRVGSACAAAAENAISTVARNTARMGRTVRCVRDVIIAAQSSVAPGEKPEAVGRLTVRGAR